MFNAGQLQQVYTDQSIGLGVGGGGGTTITLETNGTPNALQTLLNLINSASVSFTSDGAGGVTATAAPGITLQTNSVNNAIQTLLNLKNSASVTFVSDGAGGITATATGGGASGPSPYVTLTDGATITWAVSLGVNNAVVTLGGNRTLSITGATNGMMGTLWVNQPSSGGPFTLALPAGSKVIYGGGGAVLLSTAASAVDVLTWTYNGTNFLWTYGRNFS